MILCHRRIPLAPSGWQADRDCIHYGALIGMGSVIACWPLMVACTFAGHGLLALAGGLAIGWIEQRSALPRPRAILGLTLGLGAYYLALALVQAYR
jgi:hypothetical protein